MASPRKLQWGIFLAIALAALALRLPGLGARPMHTDESINAYIVGQILSGAPFHYDPVDRHGPALAALALPIVRAEGAHNFASLTESGLRLVPALAGSATVLLFIAAIEPFGFVPALVAALLFAFAPLPVYYGRDFIHETLFVAATLGLLCAGSRALRRPSISAAAITGTCAALMLATKETAVLHFAAIAAATLIAWLISRKSNSAPIRIRFQTLAVALASFLLIALLLFTWFGRNWSALADLVHIGKDTLARAAGQGHQKPFWYYIQPLTAGWFGMSFVGLACVAPDYRKNQAALWTGAYFTLIATIYSVIPYKTPWLALNLWLPLVLLAGFAVERLWNLTGLRILRFAVLVWLIAVSVDFAHETAIHVFKDPSGETNPYAYVQTSDDLLGLPDRLDELVAQRHLRSPRIAVIAADPWPLPWYLRKYPQTGFWQPNQQSPAQFGAADFFITSSDVSEQLQAQLKDFRPEFFGVRTNVLIILWVPAEE